MYHIDATVSASAKALLRIGGKATNLPTPTKRNAVETQPYLFFDGRCEEAIAFYKKALGAEVQMMMRFKDIPQPQPQPAPPADKIMHASLKIGDTGVLVSDGRCLGQPSFQGFALSLAAKDDAEAKRLFGALSDGGQVQMPLDKTFFASSFGMVADRFGVTWMVHVPA
jgi:PhnB protein